MPLSEIFARRGECIARAAMVPDSSDQYILEKKLDKWSIIRPNLPSYWTRTPDLIQVAPSPKQGNEGAQKKNGTDIDLDTFCIPTVQSDQFCKAVEKIGRFFNKEFHYDFLPYNVENHVDKGNAKIQPYLFFDPNEEYAPIARPIGSCSFYKPDEIQHWVLTWVWIHPYARRTGHLSNHWNFFRKRYDDFRVRAPLSNHMDSFLRKINYSYLI